MTKNNPKFCDQAVQGFAFFFLWVILSSNSFYASANEIHFSKIASSLETKLLIKNDVLESLKIGVSQLEKACDLEKNKAENGLVNKNPFLEQSNIKKQLSEEFSQSLIASIDTIRGNAIKTVQNKCGILGQMMGSSPTDKQLCQNTKNKIEFIDRLKPVIDNNVKLKNLEYNSLSTLFEIESAGCASKNFSKRVFDEIQSVLDPLDTSIENELKEAFTIIE